LALAFLHQQQYLSFDTLIILKNEIKVRAHKGGVRIGKTPKKLASICCP
jgi:hypothetical protein